MKEIVFSMCIVWLLLMAAGILYIKEAVESRFWGIDPILLGALSVAGWVTINLIITYIFERLIDKYV